MKKKLTALCLVVALLAIAVVGGSLAYFTDTTEAKVNTFTVGNVDITLTEPSWTDNASHNLMPGTTYAKDPTVTVTKDSQPAWVFVEVQMNKFNSWLRLVAQENTTEQLPLFVFGVKGGEPCNEGDACKGHLVADNLKTFFQTEANREAALDAWFGGVQHDNWVVMNWDQVWADIEASWVAGTGKNIKVIKPVFGYKTVVNPGESVTLFESVTMPSTIDSTELARSNFNTSETEWKLTITASAIQSENLGTLQGAYTALLAE